MALSKERKQEVQAQYEDWLKRSEAVILAEYTGLNMQAIDDLRNQIRQTGGEFHIIKNTLGKRAFEAVGLDLPAEHMLGSTAIGFAFEDPPALAKVIADFAKGSKFVKIKCGFLGDKFMEAEKIKIMADLPPLPVVRGQLLGTIMAPASKIARTLAEPGRQIAQVLKAYADQEPAPAAA